jgi:peptidoglycan hydrolase-like protein with peptidoglycan-binding domain
MKGTLVPVAIVALWAASAVRADPTTQSVQQALKDQGFYYGNVTGERNAETTAAIRRYQIRNGLHVTGDIRQ